MNGKKIAILLDFDGPLFNNDEVKVAIMRDLHISERLWNEIYTKSKKGQSYVDYGQIISCISTETAVSEKAIWKYLLNELKGSVYCSNEERETLRELSAIGHIELITQGHTIYQNIKLKSSGVRDVLSTIDYRNHRISVIPEEKTAILTQRLSALVNDGYDVVQIDDRVGPLFRVNEFAVKNKLNDSLFQIRIRTGKYGSDNAQKTEFPEGTYPWTEFSNLTGATHFLKKELLPSQFGEYGTAHATMRR